ncbi:MAG: C40 family peptidase [Syntrophobacterales bacterium]|jgi:cell wall-associated NlpC family hydrolase|nr:C40 family peptidase [Syntrophobacterales bacterium]
MRKRVILSTLILLVAILISACGTPRKVRLYNGSPDIRNEIIQTAVSLHGSPYRSGSKGPDSFDCSGFVYYVYKKSGITLPVSTDRLIVEGREVSRDWVQPGDLVFFKINRELHVGIMVNRKEFIHASKSRGIAVDDLDANYWKRNFHSFRTVFG